MLRSKPTNHPKKCVPFTTQWQPYDTEDPDIKLLAKIASPGKDETSLDEEQGKASLNFLKPVYKDHSTNPEGVLDKEEKSKKLPEEMSFRLKREMYTIDEVQLPKSVQMLKQKFYLNSYQSAMRVMENPIKRGVKSKPVKAKVH